MCLDASEQRHANPVNEGVWTDADLDGFPDSGETLTYTITVKNAGTVTLEGVEVVGTSGIVSCSDDPQPVAVLAVGDSYECRTSHQVCDRHTYECMVNRFKKGLVANCAGKRAQKRHLTSTPHVVVTFPVCSPHFVPVPGSLCRFKFAEWRAFAHTFTCVAFVLCAKSPGSVADPLPFPGTFWRMKGFASIRSGWRQPG